MQVLTTTGLVDAASLAIGAKLPATINGVPIVNTLLDKEIVTPATPRYAEHSAVALGQDGNPLFYDADGEPARVTVPAEWSWYRINGADLLFQDQSVWINEGQVTHAKHLTVGDLMIDKYGNYKPVDTIEEVTFSDAPQVWVRLVVDGDHSFIGDNWTLHNASRYAVATANWSWSNVTTNWSATSGGASGASAPTISDDAYIDGNSGTYTVGAVSGLAKALNCDFSAATITIASWTLQMYGNLILGPSITFSYGTTSMYGNGVTLTCNGATASGYMIISIESGASVTQADNYTLGDSGSSGGIRMYGGSYSTGGYSFYGSKIYWNSSGASATLTLDGSTVTCLNTTSGVVNSGYSSSGISAVNATISAYQFQSTGAQAVNLSGASVTTLATGNPSFKIGNSAAYTDTSGTTITCAGTFAAGNSNTYNATIDCAGTLAAGSSTFNGTATLSKTSGIQAISWSGATFAGTVYFDCPTVRLNGDVTVATLATHNTAARTLSAFPASTLTVTTWDASMDGTSGNVLTMTYGGATAGAWTLAKAGGGTVTVDYADISYVDASPATTWYATNSTDSGNNTGWTFGAPPGGGPTFTGSSLFFGGNF
jgi:hypothetical protein